MKLNQHQIIMADRHIQVDLERQKLVLFEKERQLAQYAVSTAKNGPGEEKGSECTPRGLHCIRIKIGSDAMVNTVFSGRRPTGEIFSRELAEKEPQRDWILTRILWLTGREPGFNRGGSKDTLRRFIYIHGCPESEPMGTAQSHGCIRMRNQDLIELFDMVSVDTPVEIRESFNG